MKTKFDIRPSSRVIKQIWSFNENVQTCWETYEVQMCSEFQENSLCLCKLSFFRIACLGDCWLNCWIGLRAFTAPEKSDIAFWLSLILYFFFRPFVLFQTGLRLLGCSRNFSSLNTFQRLPFQMFRCSRKFFAGMTQKVLSIYFPIGFSGTFL